MNAVDRMDQRGSTNPTKRKEARLHMTLFMRCNLFWKFEGVKSCESNPVIAFEVLLGGVMKTLLDEELVLLGGVMKTTRRGAEELRS